MVVALGDDCSCLDSGFEKRLGEEGELTRLTGASGILTPLHFSYRSYCTRSSDCAKTPLNFLSSFFCSSVCAPSICMAFASSSSSSAASFSLSAALGPPLAPTRLGVASLDDASAFFAFLPLFFFAGPLTALPLTTLASSTDGLRRPPAASGGKLVWRRGCADEDVTESVEALRRFSVVGVVVAMSLAARFLFPVCAPWYGGDEAVGECA